MPLFMGIDISTTGAKALLIDETGAVVASATTPLSLSTPRPLWSEQNPHDWWQGVANSVRTAIAQSGAAPEQIVAIGLTGQMHGLVLLGEGGDVLRPAILWNDQRTAAECEEIRRRVGRERLIQITGNDALTGFTAPKILWVQRHEPEVYARARHVLLPKDYIRFRLTGDYAMDKADGSGTILFDLRARNWSTEVLDALEIPHDWLPPTYEGPEATAAITDEVAAQLGLAPGTPVMAGGGDQAAGAVGMGTVTPGVVSLVLGTSGVVFATTPSALIEPEGRLHAFCHALPNRWHFMGVMLSAAGSLQWHRDAFAPGISFDALVAEASIVPTGSEGLYFLPYLTGERTPHPDPLARGAWIGLTTRHTRGHLTRALLEGVAYGLRDSFELIKSAGLGDIAQVRASGGGVKSTLWRQILADVLNVELVTVNSSEGSAFGAALCAATGARAFPDIETACAQTIRITGSTVPNPEAAAIYAHGYPNYTALYPALQPTFAAIGA